MTRRKNQIPVGMFTEQDYAELKRHRNNLAEVIQECARARACGIDTAEFDKARAQVDEQLAAIETHFMSGQGQ